MQKRFPCYQLGLSVSIKDYSDPNKVKEQLYLPLKKARLLIQFRRQEHHAAEKRVTQAKCLLTKYGSSMFFNDEPPPQESYFDEVIKERLHARATTQKKFQEDLLVR